MTLTEFLDKHDACRDGRVRAAVFASPEDAWQNCTPGDLIWAATRPCVLTDKELRLFAVFCARSVQHLLKDPRSRDAIDVAERHADGLATNDELRAAYDAAYAAYAAVYATASAAAASAAVYAADACAVYADAAAAAAYAAVYAADSAADAREQQAAWLRQNTKRNFS
jgi:hypothetical protein